MTTSTNRRLGADPLSQRAIYDTIASAKRGITVAAIRLALTGDGVPRGPRESSLIADRIKELIRRGLVERSGGRRCSVSGRTATVWVARGPYVEPQIPVPKQREAATKRRVKAHRRPDPYRIPIATDLVPVVERLRTRFVGVYPVGRDAWQVGALPVVDTETLIALHDERVTVTQVLGL